MSDYVVAIAVHIGLLILAWRTPAFDHVPRWAIVAILAAAGACKALHSALFDAAKARFRMALGRGTSGLEPIDALRDELRRAPTWRDRLITHAYILYVGMQRGIGAPSTSDRAPSQAEFLAWSVLGPTARMTVIIVALLGALRDPRWLAVYPGFGLLFANVWALLLNARRRHTMREPSPAGVPGPGRP
jgi:hypothetical protein